MARQAGRLTELEVACRESACRRFSQQKLEGKLFLNVSPESLLEPQYQSGRTLKMLEDMGLSPSRVVIELTEQTPTDDFQLLFNALHHYRDMGFPSPWTTSVPVTRACGCGRNCVRTT